MSCGKTFEWFLQTVGEIKTRRGTEMRKRPVCPSRPGALALAIQRLAKFFQSQIFLDWFCYRFFAYLLLATVRGLEPVGQTHGSFAGIAASTADGHIVFFVERSVVIEVLDGCSGGAHHVRVLLNQNTAIYASLISSSNLQFVLLGNTVCVGH